MRILVLFPGALGDLCLLAPTLAAMTAEGARVAMSVQRSLVPVATMLVPTIEIGPPMDGAALATLFADEMAPELRTWLRGADHVHAWLQRGNADGRLAARFAALGVTADFHAVPRAADGACHVGEEYAAQVGLTGTPTPIRALPPASSVLPWRHPASARLVMHPGSGARAKRWDVHGFQQVAATWIAGGGEVAILLGPAEEGEGEAWRRAGYDPHVDLPIADAAALIASGARWIGNDSGMSHLAGTLGRQGVVLFGPTRPQRWRPLGGTLAVVDFTRRSVDAATREILAILGVPFARP